jgi:hypothetical protein
LKLIVRLNYPLKMALGDAKSESVVLAPVRWLEQAIAW